MPGGDTYETPHPTLLNREQAYKLPSSKPQATLTPYSPLISTSTQKLKENNRGFAKHNSSNGEGTALQVPSMKSTSSGTLASFTGSNKRPLNYPVNMLLPLHSSPSTNLGTPARIQSRGNVQEQVSKKLKLKDKMKSRSTSTKSKFGPKVAHISTAAAQFQSFITSRDGGSTNLGSLTLASPFISRASSPVSDPNAKSGKAIGRPDPNVRPASATKSTSGLRDRVFDPNRPLKSSQGKRLSQSHNSSPRLLNDDWQENAPHYSKRNAREVYVDYKSPLLSSPRKKSSGPRDRRPSAPSRLRRSIAQHLPHKKRKSTDKLVASCPTTPEILPVVPKEGMMGPPSFVPSQTKAIRTIDSQTPLRYSHREHSYESDLDSDLEAPRWLRSSMGVGSVDFNRPPSQMSWFGFSHSGEEVDDWAESDDETNAGVPTFSSIDVERLVGDDFGLDAKGVSTPPIKPKGAPSLPTLLLESLQQSMIPEPNDSSLDDRRSSEGEMDMELSSVVGTGNITLPARAPRMKSSPSTSSPSAVSHTKESSQLISLDESNISWSTDSIISPPTPYLKRTMRAKGLLEKRASTPEGELKPTVVEGQISDIIVAREVPQCKATHKDLPKLDLRALQGNSGTRTSGATQSRFMVRTQSLPVVGSGNTESKPLLAAATKRTRSGTIVPAGHHDTPSIPAPPHSTSLADEEGASSPGIRQSVGRTRSGTIVRCNSGNLETISTVANISTHVPSAVPLSMTRRTRSGTIQAFVQPNAGDRRRPSNVSIFSGSSSMAPNGDHGVEGDPLFGSEGTAGYDLDMVGIEEEEEMEFAPPEEEEISPIERYGRSFLSLVFDDIDSGHVVPVSPLVDDEYVPQSSPDPIDFLSLCASRVSERVKMEINGGVQGSWNAKPDTNEDATETAPALIWCVADPPSPEVTLLPQRNGRFADEHPSTTPDRRKTRSASNKRHVTRKARFKGFQEEINDALLVQKVTDTNHNGYSSSEDELNLLRHTAVGPE